MSAVIAKIDLIMLIKQEQENFKEENTFLLFFQLDLSAFMMTDMFCYAFWLMEFVCQGV